jgi:ferric-dicitrate binding protein FerR (iron transport regulator)
MRMSEFETKDGIFDITRLEMALQELESGTLDPAERDELIDLITRSPVAQRAYLAYFEVSAMLVAEAATHAEHGNLPKIVKFDPPSRLMPRLRLAAAALVMLSALVLTVIKIAKPEAQELALVAAADTRWSVSGEAQQIDGQRASLRKGSTVRVDSGTVEMRLESGATMVLQGPAQVSFPELKSPLVRSGWLWLDTGPSGDKFEIDTPDLRIRNLGTRFGVRVPMEGSAEVHLIKGKLEVSSESTPGEILKLAPDETGLIIPPQGEPTAVEFARDPFPGIAGLMSAPANYPNTVRGQSPVAYWRLEDAPNGIVRNELEGESAGRARQDVSFAVSGPGTSDGFGGFDPVNRAARLSGQPGDSPLSLGSAPKRHHGLLFHETFKGEGLLHQRTPPTSLKETSWVGAPHFKADGKISAGTASATLAFKPVDGVVYTLEGSFRGVTSPDGAYPWVGLGFVRGQSTGGNTGDRFVLGQVTGRAWMLFRGSGAKLENETHDMGDSNPKPWENWSTGVGGDIDMRIVLDTTRGFGKWTATWFARRPGTGDYLKVRDTLTLPNEGILSAGIAVSGGHINAKVTDFSLRAEALKEKTPTLVRADGPSRLTRKAGAVSCWLRRDAGSGRRTILWSAGYNPADNFMHVRLEADGRVGFFIENGRYDVMLTTEEKLVDGRWHHLVASWSPGTADLYLDGQRVAQELESRELLQGSLPELQVGGRRQGDDTVFFTGEIDEFAAWNRSLTQIEVEQQFRSAKDDPVSTGRSAQPARE